MSTTLGVFLLAFATAFQPGAENKIEKDVFKTSSGNLVIYFIGHGSLMFKFNDKTIYVDPWSRLADYGRLPKADLILITHQHPDHLDSAAIAVVSKESTQIILTGSAFDILKKGTVMKNGDARSVCGIDIEAVPAYNTTAGREQMHPKGRDNGYVIVAGKKRIYVAGDTEDIPEMTALKNIDIAFLPMNQPYTMRPDQVVDAANKIHPKILYPYHFGDTDTAELTKLLSKNKHIEVRLRSLK